MAFTNHHWSLQTDHLFYPAINFTLIGKLERFQDTIDAFYAHIGGEKHLPPKLNETGSRNRYDQDLARRVAKLYRRDFDAFTYDMDDWPRPEPRKQKPRSIAESRYFDEVLERNIVIGHLYNERDRLLESVRIKNAPYFNRYRKMKFPDCFKKYIAPTAGSLDEPEANILYDLAKSVNGSCIVEIGAYQGRSTVTLALGSLVGNQAPVFSIEPHEPFAGQYGGQYGPIDRGHYMKRLVELGLFHVVRLVNLSSEHLGDQWPMPVGLLWIDGDHRYEAVTRDVARWKDKLSGGACIAFDDASDPDSGPGKVAREIAAAGNFSIAGVRGKVLWIRRV